MIAGINDVRLKASPPTGGLIKANAVDLAVDGTYIYWTEQATGNIGRAKLDGSEVNKAFITVSTPITSIQGVAVDNTFIYWTCSGKLGRAKLNGTSVNESFISGPTVGGRLAINATHLFWATAAAGLKGRVGRAKIGGTELIEAFIETGEASGELNGIAVDPTYIYWAGRFDKIGRAKLNGSEINSSLVSTSPTGEPTDVAATATRLFWADGLFGGLGRAKINGSEVENDYIKAISAESVTADSQFLYWGQRADSIYKMPFNPGIKATLRWEKGYY
jgi:virginiamycin B lyase